jgi:hypothetical protein
MRSLSGTLLIALFAISSLVQAAEKYTGPVPPKADVPYLLHANNLIETETGQAREESRKDSTLAIVPGPTSPAKTPLAEPIFIIKSDKIAPERLAAYKMDVKNGNREVTISTKKNRGASKPIYLNVVRLSDGLYKVEVDQTLENGEYTLSPEGSNQVFAFTIY